MNLVLLNLQSNQQIRLDNDNPFVIGRTNITGCSDKRVSRNHGRITCTNDGKIHVVALHTNPCFYTRNGVPPILQLNKDEEETLNEGDFLGLLPNAFWFKVTSDKEKESKTKNRTNFVKNSESANKTTPNNLVVKEELNIDNSSAVDVLKVKEETASNSENSSPRRSPGLEKTRRLPLWMYEIDEAEKKSPIKRALNSSKESKNKKIKASGTESDTKPSDIPVIKIEDDINAPSTSRATDTSRTCEESPNKTLDCPSKKKIEKEGYESDVQIESPPKVSKRPLCQYESKCYRKKPQHKLDFCHPGDEDYVPYENRPMCEYGAACYRTSKIHKVEYRHPPKSSNPTSPSSASSRASSPLPAKRRRKTVKKQDSDAEDEDDYDLEDPFINDASSDEYMPSGNSEEELDTSFQDD